MSQNNFIYWNSEIRMFSSVFLFSFHFLREQLHEWNDNQFPSSSSANKASIYFILIGWEIHNKESSSFEFFLNIVFGIITSSINENQKFAVYEWKIQLTKFTQLYTISDILIIQKILWKSKLSDSSDTRGKHRQPHCLYRVNTRNCLMVTLNNILHQHMPKQGNVHGVSLIQTVCWRYLWSQNWRQFNLSIFLSGSDCLAKDVLHCRYISIPSNILPWNELKKIPTTDCCVLLSSCFTHQNCDQNTLEFCICSNL